LVLVGQLLAL